MNQQNETPEDLMQWAASLSPEKLELMIALLELTMAHKARRG